MPDTLTTPVTLTRTIEGMPGSPQAFAAAFDFLRVSADGRYSDRTLMTISRLVNRCEDILNGLEPERLGNSASVLSLTSAVHYDEDTEVKRGGTQSMAVVLPAQWGSRLVLATTPDARRRGHAERLVREASQFHADLHTWVGHRNVNGQMFLLSLDMRPVAMNSTRALMYSWSTPDDDDGVAR